MSPAIATPWGGLRDVAEEEHQEQRQASEEGPDQHTAVAMVDAAGAPLQKLGDRERER